MPFQARVPVHQDPGCTIQQGTLLLKGEEVLSVSRLKVLLMFDRVLQGMLAPARTAEEINC